ncbi:MAG: hypothetical protein NTX85_00855 [Candidatus Nomurabacteria bacterium]|nr:hypothetical protein [Candidatus Nomurabacteria bacterium]
MAHRVTYGISCSNSFGTTISSIPIPVDNTPLPPSVSMQKTLISGNNYKISWSSTDTTSCGNPTSIPILFGANSPNPWTSQNATTGFENLTIETNTSFGITCYNSNGDSATDSVSVTPTPVTPEISMSISPAILPAGGGNFTVSWTSANTVSCHAVTPVDWTTKTSTSGSESMTIGDNPGTYDIVISCSNAIGVLATVSSRISVPERPKLSATISVTPVVGGMTDISWKSEGTNSCSATWTEYRATKGTQRNVLVRGSTEFGITCFNGEKSVTASTIVVVGGGEVTVTLSAIPAFSGGEATLVWESTDTGPGPVSCYQNNSKENINWSSWAGATTAGSGYAKGDVAKTDTFSITCKDVNSPDSKASTAFVSISVVKSNPISASLFVSPSALSSPGNVDLSWNSIGTVSCTPSWSSSNFATSGTETVAVNNKTQFTVVCTDGKSSFTTASATVLVGGSSSGITFNTNIYANPNVLYEVGTTKITWSSGSNATSCVKDWMDPLNTATNGTDTLNVSSTKLFTVTCSDGSGNEEKSSVSVVVKTPSKLRVSISATPSSSFGSRSVVGSGAGPVTLDWSSISATDCTPSWNSAKKGDLNGSESIWLSETTTFVIDCTDGNQSASASVVVNIVDTDKPLMNSSIFANPPSLPSAGGIVKLIWNSIGLSDCSQRSSSNSGGRDWTDWLGADPSTGGSAKKFLSWSDLFSITCTGPEHSATTGFVVSPSSNFDLHVSLSTDKTVFDTNGKALLSWDSNADNCTPSWNSSKNGKKDSELVNITGTETFTVVCHTNKAEASSTITVFMVDSDGSYVNLSATPSTLFGKGKSKIVWSGSNNLKCVKDWMDPADTTSDGFDIIDIVQQKTFKISCTAIGSIVPIKRSVTVGYREDLGGGGGCKGWCPISTGSAIHKSKYKER